MESDDLRIFRAVAQEGSVTKAARRLKYVQSNVTARIQQLESELQIPLFYRHRRGVTLTPAGKSLLEYANRILHLLEEARQAVAGPDICGGTLAVGAKESSASVKLPSILSAYHKQHPGVELSLRTGTTEQIISALLQYQLDCALVAGPVLHPDILQEPVIDEELVLITDRAHPPVTSAKDIVRDTVILNHAGCAYRSRLEQWLLEEGVFVKIMEFGSVESIVRSVKEGLGVSVTSRWVIHELKAEEGVRCHPIPEKYARVPTVFIRRRDAAMTGALAAFLELVKKEYASLGDVSQKVKPVENVPLQTV